MDQEEKLAKLLSMKELGFNKANSRLTAEVFTQDDLRCVFCGEDLLAPRLAYSCSGIDHIFPKATYPALENNPKNIVTCCLSCNSIKGNKDPIELYKGEDITPEQALENRDDLIARIIKGYMQDDFSKRERDYELIKEIVRGV